MGGKTAKTIIVCCSLSKRARGLCNFRTLPQCHDDEKTHKMTGSNFHFLDTIVTREPKRKTKLQVIDTLMHKKRVRHIGKTHAMIGSGYPHA
jgi:hypothetical protein